MNNVFECNPLKIVVNQMASQIPYVQSYTSEHIKQNTRNNRTLVHYQYKQVDRRVFKKKKL